MKFSHISSLVRTIVITGLLYSLFGNISLGILKVNASPGIQNQNLQTPGPTNVIVTNGKYDDMNKAWTYKGNWEVIKSINALDGHIHNSSTINDEASITFNGSNFIFIYTTGPFHGNLNVFVDGNKIAVINQHSSKTMYKHKWTSPRFSAGVHVLNFVHASGNTVDINMITVSGSTVSPNPTAPANSTPVDPTVTAISTPTQSPTTGISTPTGSLIPFTSTPTLVDPIASETSTPISTINPFSVNPSATSIPSFTPSPSPQDPIASITQTPTLLDPTSTGSQSFTPTSFPNIPTAGFTQTPTLSPTQGNLTSTSSPTSAVTPTPTMGLSATASSPTPMNGYYVGLQNGSDANPGTQSQPWKTIQKALNSVPSGSIIYILPGNYAECPNIKISVSLIATGAVVQCFRVTADDVKVQGFEITDTNPNTIAAGLGVYMTGANDSIINNYIHDMPWGGILAYANSGSPSMVSNYTIQGNRITHVGQSGIEARGVNGLIQGNDVSNIVQDFPTISNPPSWASAIGMIFFGSGHVFRNNYIHDMHYNAENPTAHLDCWLTFGDSSKGIAHDVLFDGNVCINPEFISGLAAKAWQIEGGAYGFTMTHNVVRGELIAILDNSHDVSMTYNTFVGNPSSTGSWGVQVSNSPRTLIMNNIFAYQQNGNGSVFADSISNQSLIIGKNCVYRARGNPARLADPGDVWGMNPLFVNEAANDFHLQASSPCQAMGAYKFAP
jgi:hypothetical protein